LVAVPKSSFPSTTALFPKLDGLLLEKGAEVDEKKDLRMASLVYLLLANFHMMVAESIACSRRSSITRVFEACDTMRDVLRDYGMEVSDGLQKTEK
jgi:hypothetical protein